MKNRTTGEHYTREQLTKLGYSLEGAQTTYLERAERYQTPENALATRIARQILEILEG